MPRGTAVTKAKATWAGLLYVLVFRALFLFTAFGTQETETICIPQAAQKETDAEGRAGPTKE